MITPADFRELYQDAGLTRREAARFLGRTDRQVRRWLTEGAPDWVGTMLRMRAGRLDEYGWQGWRIEGGRLLCADWKEGFEPGELFAWWWLRQKRFGYDRAEAMTDLGGEVKR